MQRTPLAAELDCDGASRYPAEIEAAIYFCCLEALQNAARHAGDDANVAVRLAETDHTLWFEVEDDGRGFDPAVASRPGLQNMIDRIGALGGTLHIDSAPGRGTTITGTIPTSS